MERRQAGKLICFTGIDGSGKTTQAKLLMDELTGEGLDTAYVWGRGDVLWRQALVRWGRRLLRRAPDGAEVMDHNPTEYRHRKQALLKSPLLRWLWFVVSKAEHVWQIRRAVVPPLRRGKIVICDRYLWDSTIDLAVTFREQERWMHSRTNRFCRRLVPKPDIIFLIDTPMEEALRRKNDIPDREYLELRMPFYLGLRDVPRVQVIDGGLAVDAIGAKVLNAVHQLIGKEGGAPEAAPNGTAQAA